MDAGRIPLSSSSQLPVFLQPSGSSLLCCFCALTSSSRRHSLASAFRNRPYFGRPDERLHGLARRQRCSMDGLGFGRPPPSLAGQSTQRASGSAGHCSFAIWDRLLREWPVANYRGVLRDIHNFQALSYRTRVITRRSLSQQTVMASCSVAGGIIFVNVSTPASPLCFGPVSRVVASARQRLLPSLGVVLHLARCLGFTSACPTGDARFS